MSAQQQQDQEDFEAERDQVLDDLPDSIKDMFGTIGFCQVAANDDSDDDEEMVSNKATAAAEYVPCLIVSPYDVPPRPVRDVYWFDYYSKCKRTKSLRQLDYLIYHYGSTDPTDCYSFIKHDEFKTYEDGVRDGDDQLPGRIQTKIAAGQMLSEEEECRVRGLQEMREDIAKPHEDRKRNADFKERHEQPNGGTTAAAAAGGGGPPKKKAAPKPKKAAAAAKKETAPKKKKAAARPAKRQKK
jgi:hypothetical protein